MKADAPTSPFVVTGDVHILTWRNWRWWFGARWRVEKYRAFDELRYEPGEYPCDCSTCCRVVFQTNRERAIDVLRAKCVEDHTS